MKLALIGTHSTGKTTIIKHLAETLSHQGIKTTVLPEFARLCPFPIDESTTLDAQAWIQEQQIKEEAKHHNPHGVLICDRSTLDNFAYMHRAVNGKHDISAFEKRAAEHMKTYDAVFKTQKLALPAEDDGVRPVDSETYESFRQHIDELIHHFFEKHHVSFHLLPAIDDYETHVREIMDRIGLVAPAILVPATANM